MLETASSLTSTVSMQQQLKDLCEHAQMFSKNIFQKSVFIDIIFNCIINDK